MTTKHTHTPGPWQVGPRYGRQSIEIQSPNRAVCHVPAFDVIERDARGIPTGRAEVANDEGLANAALIAAAPAMLAALERIHANAAESAEWIRRTADEVLSLARGA